MRLLILIFFLSIFINFPANSVSKKILKSIENCSDTEWDKNHKHGILDYEITFEQMKKRTELQIKDAEEKNLEYALKFFKQSLARLEERGKGQYEIESEKANNFTKQKIKKKLLEDTSYEKYFSECEKIREKAPITFDSKWG